MPCPPELQNKYMNVIRKILDFINGSPILRNVILAVSGILVFVTIISILLNVFTRHNTSERVPDFSGMTTEQAVNASGKHKFRVEVNDSLFVPAFDGGIILDQLPKPGTRVKQGRRIFVTVNSYKQKMVDIPYVAGYSLRQAKNILEVGELEIDKLIFREDIATYNVLEQQFNGKVIDSRTRIQAEKGSGITLVVGINSQTPTPVTPKLVGFPLNEVKSRIWDAGLNVGKVEFDADITLLNRNEAKVYVQSPEQGMRTPAGTPVNIKLTLDNTKIEKGSSDSDRAAKRIMSRQDTEDKDGDSGKP